MTFTACPNCHKKGWYIPKNNPYLQRAQLHNCRYCNSMEILDSGKASGKSVVKRIKAVDNDSRVV